MKCSLPSLQAHVFQHLGPSSQGCLEKLQKQKACGMVKWADLEAYSLASLLAQIFCFLIP